MSHSCCFHRVILAYLAFIFIVMSMGCGYQTKPFYTQETNKEAPKQENKQGVKKQNIFFQGIDTKSSSDFQEDEE